MIVILSGTGRSQHSTNGYSTSHAYYENNSLNNNIPITKFESSANYSLLSPEKGINSGTDGARVTNGEEEYCHLDRSSGKMKTTAHQ